MSYICTVGYIYVGGHITQKIRQQYLAAVLRQNISFFDSIGAGEVTTRITTDTNLVQDAISEKVCLTISQLATFGTAFVIAFIYFWKMGLIATATIVWMFLSASIISKFIGKYFGRSIQSYGEGGTIAEEVIRSIKTVVAFGVQDTFATRYDFHLGFAEKWAARGKMAISVSIASVMMAIMLNYGLLFWTGSKFLINGEVSLGKIIIIIYAIVTGAMSLGTIAPYMQAFATGVAAATKMFATINRDSPMNPSSQDGYKLEDLQWNPSFHFHHVKHIYPSRPETVVMKDLSFHFEAGKTTALVGESGSGKSSIIHLLERFSDHVSGEILLDGRDIRSLNLTWLRRQMALVSQEPVLFKTSIYENIKFGLVGSVYEDSPESMKHEKVVDAAIKANAHDFIMTLPDGYDTDVGDSGATLSGGQRQRIAIARAIVRNPRILLLDEATSALDTRSEEVVQRALDLAAKGRTTIVIAHRLSTIRNADKIVVLEKGEILEQGSHNELLAKEGRYWKLVQAQQLKAEMEQDTAKQDLPIEQFATVPQERSPTPILPTLRASMARSVNSLGAQTLVNRDDCTLPIHENRTSYSPYRSSYMRSTTSLGSPTFSNRDSRATTYRSQDVLLATETPSPRAETPPGHQLNKPWNEETPSVWELIKLVGRFNRPEWFLMLVGLSFSVIAGGAAPTQAVFFSKSITSLSAPPSQFPVLGSQIDFWALMYLMLGLTQGLSYVIHGWSFAIASERLIHRARDRAFRTILRQDISFFDQDENSVGALTSFLGQQTMALAGFSGATLGTFLTAVTSIVAACIVSITLGWKLGLVCTVTVPVLIGCGFLRTYMLARFQAQSKDSSGKTASYACEATAAIQTVAALTLEQHVSGHYHEQLEAAGKKALRQNLHASSLYAASQSMAFLCLALGFWYGGQLVSRHEYSLFEFFLCFTEIVVSAQSAGNVFAAAPDLGKARDAAVNLKKLFDQKPAIDTWSSTGRCLTNIEGRIDFENVHFQYPTRTELTLKGLSMTIMPNQYIALVGASGCGKSTLLSLLERFYDPVFGQISVDNHEITSLNVNNYRSFIALVSQQPTLYQGTIYDNIVLGASRGQLVPEEEVVEACKSANIWKFIEGLP